MEVHGSVLFRWVGNQGVSVAKEETLAGGELEDATLAFYFKCLVGGLKVNVAIRKEALFFKEEVSSIYFRRCVDFFLFIKKVEK